MDPAQLSSLPIGPGQKALPADSGGLTVSEYLERGPHLSDLTTPILALSGPEMAANVATMEAFCARHGVALAPHGKTTMAPELWQRQLDAGCWGITLANPAQLAVAREFGVPRVQIANTLVDPHGIALAAAMTAEGTEVLSWVDDLAAVRRLEEHLPAQGPALDVLLELGASGARTGARSPEAALEIARAVHTSPVLRLRGVCGYEGAVAHDRSPEGVAAVRSYLRSMRALHETVAEEGLFDAEEVILTAGGSAYFDLVIEEFAGVSQGPAGSRGLFTTIMLRSGAYITHDDGFYRGISPLAQTASAQELHASLLRPAMHAWARVVSRPEPTLALLDAGKRDMPYDEGLPEPQRTMTDFGAVSRELEGARVTAMNDQHAFLQLPADDPLAIGDVVRLGLSHPCTAFDKWRLIPEIDSADSPDPVVTGLIRTYF